MTEFFGYERTNNSVAQVISAEFATLSVGGGAVSLMQAVTADYQQNIQNVFAIGDPNIYFTSGHPSGTLQITRMAGKTGFFKSLNPGACGRIDTITINATKGQVCAPDVGGGGRLAFTGGMVQGVKLDMMAGRTEIVEAMTVKVASMSV